MDPQGCIERVRVLTGQPEAGITGLSQSGQYVAHLQPFLKLHHYSYGNIFLIKLQCPHAFVVAGHGDWKRKFGRHVKADETDITILASYPYQARDGVEETGPDGQTIKGQKWVKKTGSTMATVFDASQTEGWELSSLGMESLTGTVEGYKKLLSILKSISPVPISEGLLSPGVHGAYCHAERKITLSPGVSEAQTIKTLVHEIIHAKLHAFPVEGGIIVGAREKNRRTREVEAESMVYTVCQYLGLDTKDYSLGYITGWSSGREQTELRASLECIRDTAVELVDGVESHRLDRPPPEPVSQGQKRRTRGRKKRARISKVLSI